MYASGGLASSVNTVKRDIEDILQSGKYYCNEELARELSAINNGLEHINLDDKFLSTSPTWQGSIGATATVTAPSAAAAVNKAAGCLHDYKNQLAGGKVAEKQENQIRELHQWAVTNLRNVQRDLSPYTMTAADRIRQFGDHIGVTDRFTGYRNNLTRGQRAATQDAWDRQPTLTRAYTTIGIPSMEQRNLFGEKIPQSYGTLGRKVTFGAARPPMRQYRGYRTIDSLYPRSTSMSMSNGIPRPSSVMNDVRTMNAINARTMANPESTTPRSEVTALMTKPPTTMSVQEQAGINMTFPGRTEYMSRYTRPPMDIPTSDFIINPQPDFTLHGRPLGTSQYYPTSTEYQARYEWPDGRKCVKFPWLRK